VPQFLLIVHYCITSTSLELLIVLFYSSTHNNGRVNTLVFGIASLFEGGPGAVC